VTPVLGGVDDDGPHLFGVDQSGGVLADDYTVAGSGTQLAYGVLERRYDPDASVEAAREAAAAAVATASERDTASGDGLTLATVTECGVATDVLADPAEVAARTGRTGRRTTAGRRCSRRTVASTRSSTRGRRLPGRSGTSTEGAPTGSSPGPVGSGERFDSSVDRRLRLRRC
jgi:hypothetical protein